MAYWQTADQRARDLDNLLAKWGLKQALEAVVGFRTGESPRNQSDLDAKLLGTPEGDLWRWINDMASEERQQNMDLIAQRVALLARGWFHEIAPFR